MSPDAGISCAVCGTLNFPPTQFCTNCGSFLEWNTDPVHRRPGGTDDRVKPRPDLPPTILIASESVAIAPGSASVLVVTVGNRSQIVDRMLIAVDGPDWVTPEPSLVSVWPGESATLNLRIAPPARSDVPAGPTQVTVRVNNEQRPALRAEAVLRVEVAAFEALETRVVPQSSSGARGASHRLEVANDGNAPFTATVTGGDPNDLLDVVPSEAGLHVLPGARSTAAVRVQPRRVRLLGRSRQHRFALRLEPPAGSDRVLEATYLQTALVPLWLVVALLACVLAAGAWIAVNWPRPTDGPSVSPPVSAPATTAPATTAPASGDIPVPAGCVVTVSFRFVDLHESPGPQTRVIASVPEGDYEVSAARQIEFARQQQLWFEITVDGRTGWVRDDPTFTGPKSSECP